MSLVIDGNGGRCSKSGGCIQREFDGYGIMLKRFVDQAITAR